jgi:hypothetical protein
LNRFNFTDQWVAQCLNHSLDGTGVWNGIQNPLDICSSRQNCSIPFDILRLSYSDTNRLAASLYKGRNYPRNARNSIDF